MWLASRLLGILDRHLSSHPFLFGWRPGAADFGLYGRLTQLATFDPTPMALTTRIAPRVVAWTMAIEDLSRLEPADADWMALGQLPGTFHELLAEVGRCYVPLLLANAQAVRSGEAQWQTQVDGEPWQQQTFAYQAKCLGWLRADHAALDAGARQTFDSAIPGTGCERLFGPLP